MTKLGRYMKMIVLGNWRALSVENFLIAINLRFLGFKVKNAIKSEDVIL